MSKPSFPITQTPEGYKQWIEHLLKTKEITTTDIKLLLEDYRHKVDILSRPRQNYKYARPKNNIK